MDFNAQIAIFAAAASIVLSAAVAGFCFTQARRQRASLEACLEKNAELEKTLETCLQRLDAVSLKNEDLSRLTAWLETRVRERKAAVEKQNSPAAAAVVDSLKTSITERRYRVLSLAERGQNPDQIASTLGMFSGEVELILNLNRASA